METKMQNQELCKKICFGKQESPNILLGIIISQDEVFIVFQTARKQHFIAKGAIISISDTSIPFRRET